jgi:hypothetical protein
VIYSSLTYREMSFVPSTDHDHVTVMDLQAIYPPFMVPGFMLSLKNFYINTYKDQFFVETPPFFKLFIWSELFFQAPVMFWALGGLYRSEYQTQDLYHKT